MLESISNDNCHKNKKELDIIKSVVKQAVNTDNKQRPHYSN